MGLGQGFQQRRGMLPGQLQVADQHLHRFGVQPHQRLGQVARAQQAMPAGMAEGPDAVQGFRVVVEQQHAQRRRQRGRGRRRQALAAGDLRRLAQGEGHFLGIPGLGQVAEDATVVERVDGGIEVGIAGEENPQGLRIALASLRQQFGAAHLRHALVADQHLYPFRLQALQGAPRVALGEHLVMAAELHGQAAQDALLVIDEENADGRWAHVRRSVSVRGPALAAG